MKTPLSLLLILGLWSTTLIGLEKEIKYPVYAMDPTADSSLGVAWKILLTSPDKQSPMPNMGDLKFLDYGNEDSEFQLEASEYKKGNCVLKLKKGKQETMCTFISPKGEEKIYMVQSDIVFISPSILMNYLWDGNPSSPMPYFIIRISILEGF